MRPAPGQQPSQKRPYSFWYGGQREHVQNQQGPDAVQYGGVYKSTHSADIVQFYHVCVDSRRTYHVYGGLQDNGSWGGPNRSLSNRGPMNDDWIVVSGGDGFVCRVDPHDADIVYFESQDGNIGRRNLKTGQWAGIRPPDLPGQLPYRFNWNTPFILSNHNAGIFYSGGNYVFRSLKRGDDLKVISPELTRTKRGTATP